MRFSLFGPLLYFDLLRTTRRGRTFLLRAAYLGVILASLFLYYYLWLPNDQRPPLFEPRVGTIQALADFGASFFVAVLLAQFLAVLVLTPIYTAGAIAEEKERHTLEFLLATQLSSREIILGKLCARLANMALLLVTGLPVLGLVQLLGGVDPNLVLAGFLATALLMLSLASFGVLISMYHATALGALHRVYGWAGGYLLITCLCVAGASPALSLGNPIVAAITVVRALSGNADQTTVLVVAALGYVPVHLVFTICFTVAAIRRLRTVALRATAPTLPKELPPSVRDRPELGDGDALLWKELSEEPIIPIDWRIRKGPLRTGLFAVGVPLTLALAIGFASDPRGDGLNFQVRFLGTILSTVGLLFVGLSAVGRFSREIERQTLDALLTLPERDAVLATKRYASLRSVLPVGWTLLYIGGIGIVFRGLHFLALPLLAVAAGVYVSFFVNLGLWLSLTTRSTVRAALLYCVCVTAFPAAVWGLLAAVNEDLVRSTTLAAGLTDCGCGLVPPWTIWKLAFSRVEANPLTGMVDLPMSSLLLIGAGLLVYQLAAWWLGRRARAHFDDLTGPPRRGGSPEGQS